VSGGVRGGRRGRRERGQTATEYLMIAGLLTAMLIVLTNIIVPTMRDVGVRIVQHMVLYLTSPMPDEDAGPPPCPEFVEPEEDVECQ
jgi:hypothetical protein